MFMPLPTNSLKQTGQHVTAYVHILNSCKISLKVMIFILTSKSSHIIDINGISEDIKKTMMASKTTDDEMGLKGNEGKTTYMLKEIGSRERVSNM